MKKRIAIILFLMLLIPALCLAEATPFLNQLSNCFVIDLESSNYHTHKATAGWSSSSANADHNTDNYYDNQILAVLGVEGTQVQSEETSKPITFELTLVSGKWCYILNGTDERYMRPFGVDVFARGNYGTGGLGQDIPGYSLHLGNQANAPENASNTVTIPADVTMNYDTIWWDVCIVLDCDGTSPNDISNDTITYKNETYNLTPSDSYYTAVIEVSIKYGDAKASKYTLFLEGYYQSSITQDTTSSCEMLVTPLATANTIDIASMFGTNTQHDVATYNFTSKSKLTNQNTSLYPLPQGYVYLLLSSSTNALNQNPEKFTLRHVGTNGAVSARDTVHNSVKFNATITSENGTNSDGTSRSVTFDGTDYYGGDSGIVSKYIKIGPESTPTHNMYATRWWDNGTISVSIPGNQTIGDETVTVDGLVSGQYTSNIYVHIVTDLPSF